MAQENVELVRRWAQAFNERDMNALDDLTGPDFEFRPYLATLIEATVYRGPDGLREYFADADDGRVVRLETYASKDAALEAVGLRE